MLLVFVTSCGVNYRAPVQRPPRTEMERNYNNTWEAVRTTLRYYGFEPEYQDRRNGIITTYAESSGHFLEEMWKKDHTSPLGAVENSVQNIYRAVKVKLHRAPGDRFDVEVAVAKARSNVPEAQVTDACEVIYARSDSMPRKMTFQELLVPQGDPSPVVPMGWDERLADMIIADIRESAGLPLRGLPPVDSEMEKNQKTSGGN